MLSEFLPERPLFVVAGGGGGSWGKCGVGRWRCGGGLANWGGKKLLIIGVYRSVEILEICREGEKASFYR